MKTWREKNSKYIQRVTKQTAYVHLPDRLAAALGVMLANNSRISLQSLLSSCKHWHWQREIVNCVELPEHWNYCCFLILMLLFECPSVYWISYLSHSVTLLCGASPLSVHICHSQLPPFLFMPHLLSGLSPNHLHCVSPSLHIALSFYLFLARLWQCCSASPVSWSRIKYLKRKWVDCHGI